MTTSELRSVGRHAAAEEPPVVEPPGVEPPGVEPHVVEPPVVVDGRHGIAEPGHSHRSLSGSRRLGRLYGAAPLTTAGSVFVVLAVVRIAGAFDETLMVASIALIPAILLIVPRAVARDVGLAPISSPRALARGVGVVLGAYALVVAAMALVYRDGPDNWTAGIDTLFTGMFPDDRVLAIVAAVVCMGLLIPLAEEVCFRGVLHHAVGCRWGDGVAIVATAAVWAVVHLGDYGLNPFNPAVIAGMLPSVFLMGLALGWCRVVTGSVAGSVLAQGAANLALLAWVLVP